MFRLQGLLLSVATLQPAGSSSRFFSGYLPEAYSSSDSKYNVWPAAGISHQWRTGVTGLISGTPTAEGSFAVTLTVTDGSFTTTSTLQLTITADPARPVIMSPSTATLTPGKFFSYTIVAPSSADPSDPTAFGYLGNLPPGSNLSRSSGDYLWNLHPALAEKR